VTITDEDLRDLSHTERVELQRRLVSFGDEVPTALGRSRAPFIVLTTAACLALIGWIVVLAVRLPHRYVADHWTLTWLGFDIVLLASLGLTAWLAWRQRQMVILFALVAGTLLVCDAWFDVTTASTRADLVTSILSAAFLELPLALTLFWFARHLIMLSVRSTRAIVGAGGEAVHLWRLPLLNIPVAPAAPPLREDVPSGPS
jgi:hypothetical protein